MQKPGQPDSETAYEQICRALLQGKLRPGMPLRERQLAEVFGLTRGAVRKLLARLGAEGKVEMFPNRGAFVPQPSSKDVRELYGARKAVEAGLAGLLSTQITPAQIAALRDHAGCQRDTGRNPRETTVRLSGEYHLKLARMIGSPQLEEIVGNLISRTQVLVALFEPEDCAGCAPEEHDRITATLESGDPHRAYDVMLWHLSEVEGRILAHLEQQENPDLGNILRSVFDKGPN